MLLTLILQADFSPELQGFENIAGQKCHFLTEFQLK
jgi:hypothetical protein